MTDQTTSGVVKGASTTVAGVAVLPNTGGNSLLTVLGITLITSGVLVIATLVTVRILKRVLR